MTDVLIADDHPIVLEGLAALLSGTRFTVTSRCANGQDVLRALESFRPDLLILDINMPPPNGLALLKEQLMSGLAMKTVLLTSSLSPAELTEALALGAGGLVLKESAARRLLQCLEAVDQGDPWFDPDVMRRIAAPTPSPQHRPENPYGKLTAREIDVLRLTAIGNRNKDIGAALGITEGTVKMYLHSIFQKLDVTNRVEMVNTARRIGLF